MRTRAVLAATMAAAGNAMSSLSKAIGMVSAATGWPVEEIESTFETRPFACMFSIIIGLVLLFDVILPALWFPVKMLCQQAEERAMAEEGERIRAEARSGKSE
jgi:hypothetical protein